MWRRPIIGLLIGLAGILVGFALGIAAGITQQGQLEHWSKNLDASDVLSSAIIGLLVVALLVSLTDPAKRTKPTTPLAKIPERDARETSGACRKI